MLILSSCCVGTKTYCIDVQSIAFSKVEFIEYVQVLSYIRCKKKHLQKVILISIFGLNIPSDISIVIYSCCIWVVVVAICNCNHTLFNTFFKWFMCIG